MGGIAEPGDGHATRRRRADEAQIRGSNASTTSTFVTVVSPVIFSVTRKVTASPTRAGSGEVSTFSIDALDPSTAGLGVGVTTGVVVGAGAGSAQAWATASAQA